MVCGEVLYTGNIAAGLHNMYITGISIVSVCLTLSLYVFVMTNYQFLSNAESLNKAYKIITILCMSFMVTCSIGDLIHLIVRFIDFPNCNGFYQLEVIMISIIDGFYYLANIIFYILLLSRVYNTFTLNKIMISVLLILITIAALSSGAYIVLIISFVNNLAKLYDFTKYTVLPMSIADFILNLNFFGIFWYQMRQTVVDIEVESNIYQNISNVLTKHIVLFGIAIITNQSVFMWSISYSFYDPPINDRIFIMTITYIIRSIEISINMMVLWLVLNINYDKYIYCCKYCHLCVAKCCISKSQHPLQNPYHLLTDL